MKRESNDKEIVSLDKKPRVSKSCDESEEMLDDSGDKVSGSGVEQENPRLSAVLDVEDVGVNLNEATVEAGESGDDSVTESVRNKESENKKLSEVLRQMSGRFRIWDGSSPETIAEVIETAQALLLLANGPSALELGPRTEDPVLLNQRRDYRRRIAARLARSHSEVTVNVDANLLKGDRPFRVALKNIAQQKLLTVWSPSKDGRRKRFLCDVPSLLQLFMKELAKNASAVDSLDGIPFILRKRLADLICSSRNMNAKTLDLFVRGSPTEICIKDCSWLTLENLSTAFRNIDMKNLMVLQLELCGQCNFDYVVRPTVGSFNSLRNLVILSLKGAPRLTDDAVIAIVIAAPALQSINLSQCSLLTEKGINFIADAIGPTLKELYIDECQDLHARRIKTALLKFKNLEVLSVAGIQSVFDGLIEGVVSVCGKTLKELNLADCQNLTDYSLQAIASTCSSLHALDISKLHQLTDISLEYLANGCQLIQSLTLLENRFSDEVIAAFLETSGMSMKNLSLNKVSKVGYNTTMALAKHSRGLLSLDLSWCRRVSDEELGLIVDRCLSLRLLKLFGCSQITNVFLNGHSNTRVRIVGLMNTPLLTYMEDLKPEELLLRYSDI